MPNATKGGPPVLAYPDECWFCACCGEHCPVPGALRMEQPLDQRVGWKRKSTGARFRAGRNDPPPPNTKPPVGGRGFEGGVATRVREVTTAERRRLAPERK